MSTPLLSTKLFAPKIQPDLVARPQLLDRLLDDSAHKLILVSAPAGFGKSTFLSMLSYECDVPVAWLSLDDEDNDPARFFRYLIAALQTIVPEIGQSALTILRSSTVPSLKAILVSLINELAQLDTDIYLLLDDYHVIEMQEIHEALSFLIESSPEQIRFGLASRSDPPLPLSRLRVRGQLLEFRQADLRFTSDEAAIFLNQNAELNLSQEQIAILEHRTEGWAAGLKLAALSLSQQEDIGTFIREFGGSHSFVIDYLAEEVLSQQPDEMRQFLQQTSILDRFTSSLCEAVTRYPDCSTNLKLLEDANLFLVSLDDRREWYRYHHLFRDYLRAALDDTEIPSLNRRAANWCMSHNLYPEAVKYAFESTDMPYAASVVGMAAPALFKQGAMKRLLGWLSAIPESVICANIDLALMKGFALCLIGSPEQAIPYVQAAELIISTETPSSTLGRLMSLKAHTALCEEDAPDECIQLANAALDHLDEEEHSYRNLTYNVLGQVYEIQGDVASASDIYQKAFDAGWHSGDHLGSLVIFTNLVFSLNELGKRRAALSLCEQMDARDDFSVVSGLSVRDALYLPWSLLTLEANNLPAAREQVQEALKLLTAVNFTQGIILGQYILGRIALAQGDFEALKTIVQKGMRLAAEAGRESIHGVWFAALEAQVNLQQQDLIQSAYWAERGGYSPSDTPHHWQEFPYFTYTRLLLAEGRFADALALLDRMEESAHKGSRIRKLITIYLLKAQTLSANDDMHTALEYLERALSLAAPENYRRAILDEGPVVARLLPRVRSTAPVFVAQLLADCESVATPITVTPTDTYSLSDRELEVLQLVAHGYSNREIAEALFVTVGTVKKHLNNIFGKLHVKSRTQAVACGREQGLLR